MSRKSSALQNLLSKASATRVALRNLLIGGNLASLLLLTRPRVMVNYATESLFLLRSFTNRRILPQRNVFDIFPQASLAELRLCNTNGVTWLLCQAIQPKLVFEIGTDHGYTTAHMALNTSVDCEIYTLDLPPDVSPLLPTTFMDDLNIRKYKQRKRYMWEQPNIAPKIHRLFGDSAVFDYSPYHGRVDLFFIDGAHSYEYVRSDTLNALKCCHCGSAIVWHDFGRVGVNGVSRWLVEFSNQHPVYSIPGGSLAFCVIAS